MAVVRLSVEAVANIIRLLARGEEMFGAITRRRYEALVLAALRDLSKDPMRRGSNARLDLGLQVRTYHPRHSLAQSKTAEGIVKRPRHVLLYRVVRPDVVGIGRVLHDSMELARHLPVAYGDEDDEGTGG